MHSFLFYHCFLRPDQWTLHPWPFTPGWPSHKLITVGLIKASCKLQQLSSRGDNSGPSQPSCPFPTLNTSTFYSHLLWPGHPLWFWSSQLSTPDFLNFHTDFSLGKSWEIRLRARVFLQPILTLTTECPLTLQSSWEILLCLFWGGRLTEVGELLAVEYKP